MPFEARTHLLGFIDLHWPSDCLGANLPDSREAPEERSFDLSDSSMERLVARREEEGDLIDAEQRISVEDEGDEELAGGEFPIVEGRSAGVGGFPVTAATPDTVGTAVLKRGKA